MKSSKYRGVTLDRNGIRRKKRWISQIGFLGQHFYLGRFETEEEAALAYNRAAHRRLGDCAVLNKFDNVIAYEKKQCSFEIEA